MAIDIRGTVSCSLGEVISGSVSDSGAQGAGLIFCTGTVTVKGTAGAAPGTVVSISYSRPSGGGGTIPRQLLVIGSFTDPFRKVSIVSLGCRLTYMQDKREAVAATAFDDPNNTYTQGDAKKITVPITASSIALKCLAAIGLAGSVTLTNTYSADKFDLSAGYVQVLNDLLISESKCGYVNSGGVFEMFDLNVGGGSGVGFDAGNIIDISQGGGSGQPPGEAVTVKYSTRKPNPDKENDNNGDIGNNADDVQKRNWEKSESKDLPTTVFVSNPFYNNNPFPYEVPENFEYKYIPRTVTTSKYDTWDRLIERKTIDYTILAEIAPSYIVHRAGAGTSPGRDAPPDGSTEYEIERLQTIEYEKTAPNVSTGKDKPEGYEKIKKETSITYEPYVKLIASTPVYQLAGANNVNFSWKLGKENKFIASKTEVTYDTAYDAQSAQITKTLTNVKTCYGYTQRGQQYASYAFNDRLLWTVVDGVASSNGTAEGIITKLDELTKQGTTEEITTGRELNLQRRPGPGATNLQKSAKESKTEVQVGSGSETQRNVTFNMPYAPDDRYVKQPDGSYKLVASDAPQKAQVFGQVQNRLLLGARSGVSIQAPAEYMPSAPFSLIVVASGGIAGTYRSSGTTWSFDANGIVGSTGALFWGGVGG